MKMTIGSTWNANTVPNWSLGAPSLSPKTKLAAFDGVAEHAVHAVAQRLEPLGDGGFQDQEREAELQAQAPVDDARLNRLAVVRKQERDGDDDDQSEQPGEPLHF